MGSNSFNARATLPVNGTDFTYYRLGALAEAGLTDLQKLPITVRILLENILRRSDTAGIPDSDVTALAKWQPGVDGTEFPFLPARVVLQDFTGVPAVVDLAAMRSAVARLGGDPQKINPLVQADLVIDHSVQVDVFGSNLALGQNVEKEYERNGERYALLRWAQQAFRNFRVVPPGTGIVHQVNLEYLSNVVYENNDGGDHLIYPDTLVGTDSHTTMINGLGVLGYGVGGIEAEAILLGQPMYLLPPVVVGFKFTGKLREGVTATDLVLTVTQMLRKHGVVNKFVEFYGHGLSGLPLADRATIGNMAPEYGATCGLFPVDAETLNYLRMTGRPEEVISLTEAYYKAQGLFRTDETPDPVFSEQLELDLSTVEPSLAGPRRPQDRLPLSGVQSGFRSAYPTVFENTLPATPIAPVQVTVNGQESTVDHGSVAIAAITSCTNTSNPSVMLAAGLLAKKAVQRGLSVKPHVKTSLAPGSQVVTDYLNNAGVMPYLEALRFNVVGYGCTTCIGNSGPLSDAMNEAITDKDLTVASVISGNRNFEGRIHPLVKASFLASPPLVVAYALAGSVDTDLLKDPLGFDSNNDPVFLADVWPSTGEVAEAVRDFVRPEDFRRRYAEVFEGDERWQTLPVPDGALYEWDSNSTYVQEPTFFQNLSPEPGDISDVVNARALALLGDSITTDHISPAGSISVTSPAGRYLMEHGVAPADFNSYGARRGNHEVMMRGTFANIRLRNALANGKEGNWTTHLPTGEIMSIYDASVLYQNAGTPLVVIAGKEYGSGSSRDWAAKGPLLQGIKAAIAESFERIHRSNLVGMGILPLQFMAGESAATLGLTGTEYYTVHGVTEGLHPRKVLTVTATAEDGTVKEFQTVCRIDSQVEIEYYKNGGILQLVLRQLNRS